MFNMVKRMAGEGLVLLLVLQVVYNLMNFLVGLSMDARITLVSVLLIGVAVAAVKLK